MTDKKTQTDSNEAHEALESIQKMERAALKKAMPPRWFGAIMSLLAGSLVSLSVADLRDYHVFIILSMALVMGYQSQQSGVSGKAVGLKRVALVAIIFIPLFFGFIIAGQLLSAMLGQSGAALFAGSLFALVIYTLSIFERRWYQGKTGAGSGKGTVQ